MACTRTAPMIAALLTVLVFSGCGSTFTDRRLLKKESGPEIGGVQGPTERRLRNLFAGKQPPRSNNPSLEPLKGQVEYDAAEMIYNDGRYEEARTEFKKVAKKFKKYEIREDAIFMAGESAYQQEHFSNAHDSYAELLKVYPSTRHLDTVSKRLFEIARLWLDFPEPAKVGEIKQVNFDRPGAALPPEQPQTRRSSPPFIPNFLDAKRPWFDTEGNAVGALRAIWMNDPTGPLADDALMLAASYYARKGKYVESDRYFGLLREEYPNSPHIEAAFVLGSHVKLMSYEGPDYEGRNLREAGRLKESTLRLFPNVPEKEILESELARIREAEAQRVWEQVAFYEKKQRPRSMAVYCHLLLEDYPNTSFADKARAKLNELGPRYATGEALADPRPDVPQPSMLGYIAGARTNLPESLTPARVQPPDWATRGKFPLVRVPEAVKQDSDAKPLPPKSESDAS
jgi:outer membrane protein assembly factor BamD (BamD/ComL family)